MFKDRNLLIATKHNKEKVIAPILEKELGVKCILSNNFDTDQLGTFSGEIERIDDPITTARKKCLLAIEASNCDLAIASEGSFGPHPNIHFVPANEEILIFIDKLNDFEIMVREVSIETNFNNADIKTESDLYLFAEQAKFPSHGLIIKNSKENFVEIVKGIIDFENLIGTFQHFIKTYGTVHVETDMRAMFNPTRMSVIEKATIKIVDKINSLCPDCNTPGFGITQAIRGLPCSICNCPTDSILSYIYTCQKCAFKKNELHPFGKTFEEPMYCNFCNP